MFLTIILVMEISIDFRKSVIVFKSLYHKKFSVYNIGPRKTLSKESIEKIEPIEISIDVDM